MWFRMWRITALACKESNPVDYNYWSKKGWYGSNYYTNTKVGIIKNLIADISGNLMKIILRRVYKDY